MLETNLNTVCAFVSEAADRPLPEDVCDLAKRCLVDWFSVSLAALHDTGPMLVRQLTQQWRTHGKALSLFGDRGAAAPVALVNGTLSHSLDFDDMHFGAAYHASGPTLAAALAVGMEQGSSEEQILRAFVAGYEVGATLGSTGIGTRLLAAGWHPTGVLAHFSAAAAAAVLLRLTTEQVAYALGLAATQAAGLQASGGTMAKPFHVGKATMNGIMAAEMARIGMDSSMQVFDDERNGIFGCLFQAPTVAHMDALGQVWQIKDNTFKPYASCQLTHAPYQTALGLSANFSDSGLREICIHVNPLAKKVAGRDSAATAMEGKFSIAYCVALGLLGYSAGISGFTDERLHDMRVQSLLRKARIITDEGVERWAATIDLVFEDGRIEQGVTSAVRGSPSHPMLWHDIDAKFMSATQAHLGEGAARLLEVLHGFERPGSLSEVANIIEAAATASASMS